ncbi:hypothetical protein BGL34_04675 [Fructilactobacillus lindneri]|uniref:Uncharacterized protein n=2 Tax=Fructilactobacillus lindneri TaxID=53444 RepID=A0A0R2JM50_9LACO|nr:hypothetical protein [Fructilactobacillus lindneri]ANZ57565.1 hypothetical protein AYR60_01625 [Fructilactobacillus lindneri]ANZ58834.1 hypothetical protein AYR59_01625 [Fructilactobacillus lindneri]KRN78248.1 hypothetical protein IV52_GL001382 [Fructilactobacillus lindneri DSM 20690 = JCM 11027]POG97673.1 hypothetical protein BGL31_06130 [Fructilactobacillus lindneri]POH00060.1 hypothetical protein BGL32_04695 [Fructilactobacillus lindneri]
MITLKELHDKVKSDYESGKYDSAKKFYTKGSQNKANYKYTYHGAEKNNVSDYQRGYTQALNDYNNHRHFKLYPKRIVDFLNKLLGNRLIEISDFIDGYVTAKHEIKRNN